MPRRAHSARLLLLVVVMLLAATGICSAATITVTTADLPISFYLPGPGDSLVDSILTLIISNITWAKEGSISLLESDGTTLGNLISFINLVNQANIVIDSDPDLGGGGGGGGGGFSLQFVKDGSTNSVDVPTDQGPVIEVSLESEGPEGTEVEVGVVPAPTAVLLLGLGLLAAGAARRLRV